MKEPEDKKIRKLGKIKGGTKAIDSYATGNKNTMLVADLA